MITTFGETYELKLYKRKENSPYEWDETPSLVFKGRPANQIEVSKYRIQKGVNGNSDSSYILSSNLPAEIKPGDRIEFIGKIWTVESTGYYFENSRLVNAGVFSPEAIVERCPKGIVLK